MKKKRDKTIAAQIRLIGMVEAEAAAPKNDGLGFARIMIGGTDRAALYAAYFGPW